MRDVSETTGQRLKRLRKERGLTQVEIAERLGLTQSLLSKYERDEFRLNADLIVRLGQLLGVSADELLGMAPPKSVPMVQRAKLARRIRQIDQLPKRDQRAIMRLIDGFMQGAKPHASAAAARPDPGLYACSGGTLNRGFLRGDLPGASPLG